MNKLARTLISGATLAMPLTLLAGTPGAMAAGADAAVITGSGSILPGLNETPRPQTINFTGNAQVVGTDGVLANYPCSFSGNDLAGSVAEGVGTVAGSCGPIAFPTCVFARVAVAVGVVCASTSPSVGGAVCVFTPNNTNPTTSYGLICAAAAVYN